MSTPLKVLVADDTPSNVKVLRTLLRIHGYEVVTAENGRQAVDTFEAEHPDVVLMDVVMPVMGGYDACRLVRKADGGQTVPIIMVTASAPQERDRAIEAGANEVLMKPVDQERLLALMASLLGERAADS